MDKRYTASQKNKLKEIAEKYTGEGFTEIQNDIYDIVKGYYGEKFVDMQHYKAWSLGDALMCEATIDGHHIAEYRNTEYIDTALARLYDNGSSTTLQFDNAIILIWFPEVTITNERNNSRLLKDIYVKLTVSPTGSLVGVMEMARSTLSMEEYVSGYAHSHLRSIDTVFRSPCFGSGPIVFTMGNLNSASSEDKWMLLCREIELYVGTESISGVPYHRMSNICGAGMDSRIFSGAYPTAGYHGCPNFLHDYDPELKALTIFLVKKFLFHYMTSGKYGITFSNGQYKITDSISELNQEMTKDYIKWLEKAFRHKTKAEDEAHVSPGTFNEIYYRNSWPMIDGILTNDGKLCYGKYSMTDTLNGMYICDFKDSEIRINVTEVEGLYHNILNPLITFIFINAVDRILNIYYNGKGEDSREKINGLVGKLIY